MSKLKVLSLSCMLALALTGPAFLQYIYLDANGDGDNTATHGLTASGQHSDRYLNTTIEFPPRMGGQRLA